MSGAVVSISASLRRYEAAVNLGRYVPGLATRTDEQGRFRLADLPADEPVQLIVTAPGQGRLDTARSQEEGYLAGQGSVDLQMPRAATVEAVVKSKETGKPIDGVPLVL